ncbi:lipoprotein [mine drainage metagenome]|uniref:Lipoprotein n=1 Tax=mine drainage metagenome TaxID=410659 RepID=T1DB96_9ZZZZ
MAGAPPTEAGVGEEFSIALPSNPSTGFSWQIEVPAERLELLHREYVHSSHLIGAGGQEMLRFRARVVGEAMIVCKYLRPWEGRAVEERRFSVRIHA